MDRREFLRRAMSLAPALVVVPTAVSYFLPPKGGWTVSREIQDYLEVVHRLIAEDMRRQFERAYDQVMGQWGEHPVEGFGPASMLRPFEASMAISPRNWFSLKAA